MCLEFHTFGKDLDPSVLLRTQEPGEEACLQSGTTVSILSLLAISTIDFNNYDHSMKRKYLPDFSNSPLQAANSPGQIKHPDIYT